MTGTGSPPSHDPNVAEILDRGRAQIQGLREEVAKVVVGHRETLDGLLIALLGGGHVLVEGVPGLGKTLLVQTLSSSLGLEFRRIQCTPDLMPADILGTRILIEEPGGGREFRFQEGPVFTNILLADEINRATPKTQSALLEAMQEHKVTIAGERRTLEEPFFVMATQNPIEMEGTFPLPEAQVDRFLFKLLVELPSVEDLEAIVDRTTGTHHATVQPVLDREQILTLRRAVREVPLPSPVKRYAMQLIAATHPTGKNAPDEIRRFVRYGASPRGAQALVLAARVRAALDGRPNASFEDVRWAAHPALRHRLVLSFEGIAEGATGDSLVDTVLAAVPLEQSVAQTSS